MEGSFAPQRSVLLEERCGVRFRVPVTHFEKYPCRLRILLTRVVVVAGALIGLCSISTFSQPVHGEVPWYVRDDFLPEAKGVLAEVWVDNPEILRSLVFLRNVTVGPDGHLYVLTSTADRRAELQPNDDKILRLRIDASE